MCGFQGREGIITSESSSSKLTGGGENAPHLEACSASDHPVKQGKEGNQRIGLKSAMRVLVTRSGMYIQ
jgi:hypothetical protein